MGLTLSKVRADLGGMSVGKVPDPWDGRFPGGDHEGRGATLRASRGSVHTQHWTQGTQTETHPNGSKKAHLAGGQEADSFKGLMAMNRQLPTFADTVKREAR